MVLVLCVHIPNVRADRDVVVERLTEYGELSVVQARALRSVISKRMARAKREGDGVRVAVEQAIAGSRSGAGGAKSSAELKKRLRAGLDRWALEALFAPGPSSMVTCSHMFRLSAGRCDALLAAAGEVPLARVAALSATRAPAAPTPRVEREATAMHVSGVVPQPLSAESAAALDAEPLELEAHPARKTQLPEPMPPAVARGKAEYDQQRAAYWARRRQELDARLVQIRSSGGGQRVQRGPASELEREVVGLSPGASHKPSLPSAAKPSGQPSQLAHNAPSKDEPGAETADLIDGLTADPLGKQAP
jgi:hypothetical protein